MIGLLIEIYEYALEGSAYLSLKNELNSMHCARCYHRLLFFISLGSIIKLEFPLLDMLSD